MVTVLVLRVHMHRLRGGAMGLRASWYSAWVLTLGGQWYVSVRSVRPCVFCACAVMHHRVGT